MSQREELQQGWSLLISQARIIAMLPLEDWLEAIEKAEAIAPYVDPALYRDYIQDPDQKGERLKGLIKAAIPLKQEILKMQGRYLRVKKQAAKGDAA